MDDAIQNSSEKRHEFLKKVAELGLDRMADAVSAHHSNGTGADYESLVKPENGLKEKSEHVEGVAPETQKGVE